MAAQDVYTTKAGILLFESGRSQRACIRQSASRRFVSKVTRELKKHTIRAETAARSASDDLAANQLKALAAAFRTQAKVIEKNKKRKPVMVEISRIDISRFIDCKRSVGYLPLHLSVRRGAEVVVITIGQRALPRRTLRFMPTMRWKNFPLCKEDN